MDTAAINVISISTHPSRLHGSILWTRHTMGVACHSLAELCTTLYSRAEMVHHPKLQPRLLDLVANSRYSRIDLLSLSLYVAV